LGLEKKKGGKDKNHNPVHPMQTKRGKEKRETRTKEENTQGNGGKGTIASFLQLWGQNQERLLEKKLSGMRKKKEREEAGPKRPITLLCHEMKKEKKPSHKK